MDLNVDAPPAGKQDDASRGTDKVNLMCDRIEQIEREQDRLALRLQALAAEPSPWCVEGFCYETWEKASHTRGALTLMLLNRIDALNLERCHLLLPEAA